MGINVGQIFVSAAAAFIRPVGAATLVQILEHGRQNDPEGYKELIQGIYPFFKGKLTQWAEASKTKIDDGLVGAVTDAVEESAEANEVTLPA